MSDLDQLANQLQETAEQLRETHRGLLDLDTNAAAELADDFDLMLGEVEWMLDQIPVLAAKQAPKDR